MALERGIRFSLEFPFLAGRWFVQEIELFIRKERCLIRVDIFKRSEETLR